MGNKILMLVLSCFMLVGSILFNPQAVNANKGIALTDTAMAKLPKVATFILTSTDITDGKALPSAQLSGLFGVKVGQDLSPQLSWAGAPAGTKSYAITCYDPDAPTGSGFWHWAVVNIPATVTSLASGAGDAAGSRLPQGAIQLPNDARLARFVGAAPPAGSGIHRYIFTVYALDVAKFDISADATPALLGFLMYKHTLGRGVLIATSEYINFENK